ncbi:MAG TPA: hypothetical protein VFU16_06870 [Solirubrobacterales bacterium]|nr:hypothetical protein [Solirubrobacterales bacterium]
MREKVAAVADFLWRNVDPMIVIAVAFGVALLETFGSPSRDVVDAAILATLGTTAIVLLRDRLERGRFDALEQLAGDAISDRPYEVVWQSKHWDLRDRRHATVKKTEQIRFTRNDVSTNFDWTSGDGQVENVVAKWRRSKGLAWIPAKKIHEFQVRGGTKEIYCLDEEHNRGDMLDWCTIQETVDRFSGRHETVEIRARTKSEHPRVMRITWPADEPPDHVEIRYDDQPARPLQARIEEGRPFVEERVSLMAIGSRVKIDWTW